jgi:hypothetical protein
MDRRRAERIDDKSYTIRYRLGGPGAYGARSILRKIAELKKRGLMRLGGLAAFEKRNRREVSHLSYEKVPEKMGPEYEKLFRKEKRDGNSSTTTIPDTGNA